MAQSSTAKLYGVLINSYGKECPVLLSFAVHCDFEEGKPSIKRGLTMVITLLCKVFGKVMSIAENCFE